MICPRCHSDLIVVEYHDIELDYCPACEGLWFDSGEMEVVATRMGASTSDLVPKRKADTREARLKCPECHKAMDKRLLGVSDPVIADVCPLCEGLWLDHGELERVVSGSAAATEVDTPVVEHLRDTFLMQSKRNAGTPDDSAGDARK